jgi:hypothetical protein
MSSAASGCAHLQPTACTQEQLEAELKRLGPRAYITKDKYGNPMVSLKRRREVKEQEKMHPAQNWAPDSLANTKRPRVWPTYKCTSCACDLPWAVSPETQCSQCAGRDESDDGEESDSEHNGRPEHDDGTYREKSIKNKFTSNLSTSDPHCAYCEVELYGYSKTTLTVSTRWRTEAFFCDFDCLMRMGVQTRDELDREGEDDCE